MSPIYGNALWLAPDSRLRRSQLPETKQNTDTPDRMFAFHCSEHEYACTARLTDVTCTIRINGNVFITLTHSRCLNRYKKIYNI